MNLLQALGGGDQSAFEQLYRLTRGDLTAYARRLVRAPAAADDVLQEAFLAIWTGAYRYDPLRSAPMTWLRTIVRNKAFDLYRWQAARLPDSCDAWDENTLPASEASPCERLQATQQLALLSCWLGYLCMEQRRAIELTWMQQLSHAHAAERMGKPLGTVKTLVRRGLIGLRISAAAAAAAA